MKFYLRSFRRKMESLQKQARQINPRPKLELVAQLNKKWKKAMALNKEFWNGDLSGYRSSVCKLTGDLKIWHLASEKELVLYETFPMNLDYPFVQSACFDLGLIERVNLNEFERYNCWYDYWHKEEIIRQREFEERRLANFLGRFGNA